LIWDATVFAQSFGQVSHDEVCCDVSNKKDQRPLQGEKEQNGEVKSLKYKQNNLQH